MKLAKKPKRVAVTPKSDKKSKDMKTPTKMQMDQDKIIVEAGGEELDLGKVKVT